MTAICASGPLGERIVTRSAAQGLGFGLKVRARLWAEICREAGVDQLYAGGVLQKSSKCPDACRRKQGLTPFDGCHLRQNKRAPFKTT